MKNTLPSQLDRLFTLGEDMAVGCHNHEAAIGLLQNKEVNVRADLTAARNADNAYQAAKTARLNAVQAQSTADENATAFIVTARDVLKARLGTSWSQMWAEVGFVNRSFSVPNTLANRIALLMSLKMYFTAHADYEADQVGVTAEAANAKYTALSTARAAVNRHS